MSTRKFCMQSSKADMQTPPLDKLQNGKQCALKVHLLNAFTIDNNRLTWRIQKDQVLMHTAAPDFMPPTKKSIAWCRR